MLDGKLLALKTNAQAIAEGIAYVSEDRLTLGLVLEQPIASNILITVLDKLVNGLGFVPEARAGGAPRKNGSTISRSRRPTPTMRSRRCPAAISNASCSPNGWRLAPSS